MRIDWPKLIASLVLCQGAGFAGSLVTVSAVSGWYATLVKPAFTPPSWVFAPVWTVLYLLMGLALYLVWSCEGNRKTEKKVSDAMHWFWLQLTLNVAWSYLFFGLRDPLLALFGIVFLAGSVFLTARSFFAIDRKAGWLLVPYLAWILFAAVLNFSIWQLNG